MAGTAIRKCTCAHEFQDKRYGPGMRLHNECKKGDEKGRGYRCTVCADVKK
jgi:hypothetical protein